eukprot:TRINITY_DN602_c0_g1_i1.p1 TRINITY_DN602_c0_g1~~TRINITY_DN602_c0_g1_i1.p1  ORF type:complete len:853 (-),score=134.63 TRINITY_DN602_c0_g1_i1:176-2653(-)
MCIRDRISRDTQIGCANYTVAQGNNNKLAVCNNNDNNKDGKAVSRLPADGENGILTPEKCFELFEKEGSLERGGGAGIVGVNTGNAVGLGGIIGPEDIEIKENDDNQLFGNTVNKETNANTGSSPFSSHTNNFYPNLNGASISNSNSQINNPNCNANNNNNNNNSRSFRQNLPYQNTNRNTTRINVNSITTRSSAQTINSEISQKDDRKPCVMTLRSRSNHQQLSSSGSEDSLTGNNWHSCIRTSTTANESGKRKQRPVDLHSFEEDRIENMIMNSNHLVGVTTRRGSCNLMLDEKIEKKRKVIETPEERRAALMMMDAETSMGSSEMHEECILPRRSSRLNKNIIIDDDNEELGNDSGPKTQRQKLKRLVNNKRETKLNSAIKPALDACSICLTDIAGEIGILLCNHRFCFSCIKDWSDVTNLCPLCKVEFREIVKTDHANNQLDKIEVEAKKMILDDEDVSYYDEADDQCYICEQDNNEYLMLVCDRCNFYCCHTYCLTPPMDTIPDEEWYCDYCMESMSEEAIMEEENSGVRMTRSRSASQRGDGGNANNESRVRHVPSRTERNTDIPPSNILTRSGRGNRENNLPASDNTVNPRSNRNRGRRITTFLENIASEARNDNRLRRSMRLLRQRRDHETLLARQVKEEEDNEEEEQEKDFRKEDEADEKSEEGEEDDEEEEQNDSRMEEELSLPRRPQTRSQVNHAEDSITVIRASNNVLHGTKKERIIFDVEAQTYPRRILRSQTQRASFDNLHDNCEGEENSCVEDGKSFGEKIGVTTRSQFHMNTSHNTPVKRSATMDANRHQSLRLHTANAKQNETNRSWT